jgi:hypothetical protein
MNEDLSQPFREHTITETKVCKEVLQAYYDCWSDEPWSLRESKRNLEFRASESVDRNSAKEILHLALGGGYNDFTPDLLDYLPEDCEITIAREGSVCLYVKNLPPDAKPHKKLLCNEWNYIQHTGETRIWWD